MNMKQALVVWTCIIPPLRLFFRLASMAWWCDFYGVMAHVLIGICIATWWQRMPRVVGAPFAEAAQERRTAGWCLIVASVFELLMAILWTKGIWK